MVVFKLQFWGGKNMQNNMFRKGFVVGIIVLFVVSGILPIIKTTAKADLTKTLVVYIGAHPDDIDIGMSGSLFKYDVGKHPILWIVVTDGGADSGEYEYETNASRNWLVKDSQNNVSWKVPDGNTVNRVFYSPDLAESRCGGYISGLSWIEVPASHDSSFGVEYDWRTRAHNIVGATMEGRQLSYLDPNDPSKRLLYPDGALMKAESAFTNSIAANLAYEINQFVITNGYRKNLLHINSHAPVEVCTNYEDQDHLEHPDHKVTGNAVRQAIDILHNSYGFGQIDTTWYTIYYPIQPKQGYIRMDENILQYKTLKSNLCKTCWETDWINSTNWNISWVDYPKIQVIMNIL